jgi:predicted metalloprotease with PDZ domain
MFRRLASSLLILLLAVPLSARFEKQLCPLSAKECEKQIREMLSGKRYLGLKLEETRNGLVIKRVVPDSPADRFGLRELDRIISVNGVDCTGANIKTFKQILNRMDEARKLDFTVDRSGFFRSFNVMMEVMSKQQIDQIVAAHLREAHRPEKPQGGATAQKGE